MMLLLSELVSFLYFSIHTWLFGIQISSPLRNNLELWGSSLWVVFCPSKDAVATAVFVSWLAIPIYIQSAVPDSSFVN